MSQDDLKNADESFTDGICSECGTPDLAGAACKLCGGPVVKIDEGLEQFEPPLDDDETTYPAGALKAAEKDEPDIISLEEADEAAEEE